MIVSVATPSFNQGRFIGKTIESVIAQSGDFLIDFLIMDGGSDDDSTSIIEGTEQFLIHNAPTFSRDGLTFFSPSGPDSPSSPIQCAGLSLRWFSGKDNGQTDALKKSFRLAKGEILCWLNSDDFYIDHTVLHRAVCYFRENPAIKLLIGDGIFVNREGEFIGPHHTTSVRLRELIYLDYHILQPATFFRREIYRESMLNEQFICAFDADFFIGLISGGAPFLKVNDSFAAFRFYPENKTLSLHKKKFLESTQITRKFGKNPLFRMISFMYRFLETTLRPVFYQKRGFKSKLFAVIRRLCYRLIMGSYQR